MDKIFKLKEHGTTVRTEIMAGAPIFVSMVYTGSESCYAGRRRHGQCRSIYGNGSFGGGKYPVYGVFYQLPHCAGVVFCGRYRLYAISESGSLTMCQPI